MKVQRSRCQPSGRRLPRLKVTPREFVSDLKVLRDQLELFGEVASQPTAWGAEPTYKSNVPRARRSLVKTARLNFSGPGPLRPAGSTEPLALNTMRSRAELQARRGGPPARPPPSPPRRLPARPPRPRGRGGPRRGPCRRRRCATGTSVGSGSAPSLPCPRRGLPSCRNAR